MAVLQSCCFWKSVRKGSYASAIYTMIYFGGSCIIISIYLSEEHKYLTGKVNKPTGESFLEKEAISPTTVIFNILLLICASCGFISSILVIISLKKDQRELIIPWIIFMLIDLIIECSHFIYLVIIQTLDFEPLTATLFTIDFFIICLNIYCVLCVISQYQEYKAGRGYAIGDENQTADSSRSDSHIGSPLPIPVTNLNTFHRTKGTKTFSTYPNPIFKIIGTTPPETPSIKRHRSISFNKKHVKFPDDKDDDDDENQHEHKHNSFVPILKKSSSNETNDAERVLIDVEIDNIETTSSS